MSDIVHDAIITPIVGGKYTVTCDYLWCGFDEDCELICEALIIASAHVSIANSDLGLVADRAAGFFVF